MVAFNRHELKIQCWNIHGAFYNLGGDRYCKLTNDPDVVEHISTNIPYFRVSRNTSLSGGLTFAPSTWVCVFSSMSY